MASDASETLVLDQCALFALRCAVGAAQDREVSSQEIIGYDDTTVSHRPTVPSHKHIAPAVIFEWDEINSCLRGSEWVEKLKSLN